MLARTPVQMAYLVDDLEAAAASWAATTGAGPFFVHRGAHLPDFRDGLGHPGVYDHDNALGQWGPVMIELIELGTLSVEDPRTRATISRRDGLHHIAWFRPEGVDEGRRLAAAGWPVIASWSLEIADEAGVRLGFNDATRDLGCLVEHYPPNELILGLYTQIAESARGWDGRDPVRGDYLDAPDLSRPGG
jgi:Glyoxalase/Bleomycin resistance protein/Dioxygenase superfamily